MAGTFNIISFSFKQGLPAQADMVVDVRFLKNPFYEPSLTALSGLDKAAADYIESDPECGAFFDRLVALLLPVLPRYLKDRPFTLAIGCTGGLHRSVYMAEKMAGVLRDKGYGITVTHRDLTQHPSLRA